MDIRSKLKALENIAALPIRMQYITQTASQVLNNPAQPTPEYMNLHKEFTQIFNEMETYISEIKAAIPVFEIPENEMKDVNSK